jgi:CMP-N-acetylneuraminic acid synthetase
MKQDVITDVKAASLKPPGCHIVAIIGARGGSKGLPKKNIRVFAGKPLIAWTIEAARKCPLVDRVIVSTDDEEIAKVAKRHEAEVPFRRPAELAADEVPSVKFLQHAVEWLESHENYRTDIVLYLQLTDVFRKRQMLEEVITRLLKNPSLDTAFVGHPTHKNFWKKEGGRYRRLTEEEDKPRQLKQPVVREDSGLACATRGALIKSGRRIGDHVDIVMNHDVCSSIDIHDKFDLWLAEKLVAEEQRTLSE